MSWFSSLLRRAKSVLFYPEEDNTPALVTSTPDGTVIMQQKVPTENFDKLTFSNGEMVHPAPKIIPPPAPRAVEKERQRLVERERQRRIKSDKESEFQKRIRAREQLEEERRRRIRAEEEADEERRRRIRAEEDTSLLTTIVTAGAVGMVMSSIESRSEETFDGGGGNFGGAGAQSTWEAPQYEEPMFESKSSDDTSWSSSSSDSSDWSSDDSRSGD